MGTTIIRGCLISFILLLIGIILWSDYSFLFIGLSIVSLGIVLLHIINDSNDTKK